MESAIGASSTTGSSGGLGNPLAHPHWHLLGMTFNSDTLITMWVIMAILVIGCTIIVRTADPDVPTPLQNALEYVFDFIGGFIQESVNPRAGGMLFDYLATTLVFLLVATLAGIVPLVHSPVSDADVPIGMAAIVFVMTHYYGFRLKGLKYFKHFAPPAPVYLQWFLVIMALIELIANPITLSMRIFGNIFAGELLTRVLDYLLPFGLTYPLGVLVQVPWLLFSMFIAAIQSYVFMALTLTYVGMATAEEHGEERHAA